jgi:hypothetical protein
MPAGNSLATATNLNLHSAPLQISGDSVNSSTNGSDFYSFKLNGRSSFNLSLNSLSPNGDVNVELLNSSGTSLSMNGVAQTSQNAGNLLDSINIDELSSGQYYIHVFTSSSNTASYELKVDSKNAMHADLLWRNYGTPGESGKTNSWVMDGVNPQQTVNYTNVVDLNWKIAGTGDFNKDGQSDLVWRNYGTSGPDAGKVVIWTMNGVNATQTVYMPFTVSDTNWHIEGVADFNQDGQSDLVWRNYGTSGTDAGKVAIWTMNGTSPVQTIYAPFTIADTNWKIEGVADFNQDGQTDLVWRNYGTSGQDAGKVAIWTMNGVNPSQTIYAPFTVADTNWHIEGIADFNKDGQSDLVWRNYGTSGQDAGKVAIWTMNGTNPVQTVYMPFTVSDPNWHLEGVRVIFDAPPKIDGVGNSQNSALALGTLSTNGEFREAIGAGDTDDYYQFTVANSGNYELKLDGLSADANIQLFDGNGNVIGNSQNAGVAAESIVRTLSAGTTYYARVYGNASPGTRYHLNLATSQANINAAVVDLNGAASGNGFSTSFTEDGAAVAIVDSSALTILDIDSGNISSAVVTISNLKDGSAEVLNVDRALATSYGVNSNYANGVLTLSGNATVAQYQALLRTTTYNNTSQSPDSTNRVINFVVNDGTNTSTTVSSTVSITPTNDNPVNISLSQNSVHENSANGTVVANLSTTDLDLGDTHTYTLVNDAGGRFKIVGNELQVANGALLDYETIDRHDVTVRTTDQSGLSFERTFTLNITDINNTVAEIEPNNVLASAQNIDRFFDTRNDASVAASTTTPFVSIQGTGDDTYDYYSFTVSTAGSKGTFDIDATNGWDATLFLFNSAGDLLTRNDDGSFLFNDAGSISLLDPSFTYTFANTGTYYLGVSRFSASQTSGGIAPGSEVPSGKNYTLNLSVENHLV